MNIIITGASKGIGFELVKLFAQNAHTVAAISRDTDKLKKLQALFPSNIHVFPFDLDQTEDGFKQLVIDVTAKMPSIDVVLNNAGILINKPLLEQNTDDFDAQFNINVKAPFLLTKSVFPFLNKGAHIVNISSMGGVQQSQKFAGLSLYSAAKGALSVLTECMSTEFAALNISANCLALGAVQTEMLSKAFPHYKAPVKPEEMASFIKDFALNGARFFNGKIIPVALSNP